MKFAARLREQIYQPWQFYYLDYDGLKRLLKDRTSSTGGFSDQDEASFVEMLERELEKVASFRQIKGDELSRRVAHCEREIAKLVKSHPHMGGVIGSPVFSAIPDNVAPEYVRLATLKQDVNKVLNETSELSKFTRINYTGFMKILKKHDKRTSFQLKPMFLVRLNSRPFFKESVEDLVVRLSRIFQTVRTGASDEMASSIGVSPPPKSKFVRHTAKYWIEYDNVDKVRAIILKKLPAMVVNNKTGSHNPAISSIYLDDEQFQLYAGRLEKQEGAESIRLRWYGNMDQSTIFVERKVHHNPDSTITSEKSRFAIQEKFVNQFLRGEYKPERLVAHLRDEGEISDNDVEDVSRLATLIQNAGRDRKLRPVIRTFYNRTAFQLPGDSRVRISLDTDLTFIREDNAGRTRSGENWRRPDCGVSWPFDYLPSGDFENFPYAVLEVKIETLEGATTPDWVQELVESNLVVEVKSFSKFVHGVAVLLESRVSLLPFWLTNVSKDVPMIAAMAVTNQSTKAPGKAKVPETSNTGQSRNSPDELTAVIIDPNSISPRPSPLNIGQPVAVPSPSSSVGTPATSAPDERTSLLGGLPFNKRRAGRHQETSAMSANIERWNYSAFWSTWTWKRTSVLGPNEGFGAPAPGASGPIVSSAVGVPSAHLPAKAIQLPVRVEPKVFFANERTFLSWLHFCIVLGGLALGLLNFGDQVGQISGVLFTCVALLFMLYSLILFQWRADKIRRRDPGPYDDRVGPTVLVFILFAVVGVNFYLKFLDGTLVLLFARYGH
ncbi:VTC domain-containing protein [Zopfochytrium polystomum]|nr:VTC domain-containing protein [Zopfochytrium polystomum]